MELIDSWFNSEGEYEGMIGLIRGRDKLFNFIESGIYNDRLEIEWKYNSPDNTGLPTDQDFELMSNFEDVLIENFEHDLHSVLSFVYTWNNSKTWFWYTKSVHDFGERLNNALTDFDTLPIKIKRIHDPGWNEYLDMAQGCGLNES